MNKRQVFSYAYLGCSTSERSSIGRLGGEQHYADFWCLIHRVLQCALLVGTLSSQGCSIFFPGNSNSFDRANEHVSINLIPVSTMTSVDECKKQLPASTCVSFPLGETGGE